MPPLKISVVIPTLNRPDDLRRCLSALEAQERQADEVIVVIGPGDQIAPSIFNQVGKQDPNWKLVQEQHCSVVISLNAGISIAQGDIIVLTDDDAAPPPNWLALIESHFLRDPKVGAVGGRDRLMYVDQPRLSNPEPARNVGQFNWYGLLEGNHHCGSKVSPLKVDVLKGVNLSFRRDAFRKGQIDSYLTGYGAEVGWEIDICLTIKRAGYTIVYDNEVFVNHYAAPRLAGDNRQDFSSTNALRRIQNTSYIIAFHQRLVPTLMMLAKSILIGSRYQPGLIWGLAGIFKGKPWLITVSQRVIFANCRGFWDGRMKRRQLRDKL